ncbi:MAG: hypothetical protein IJ412_11880 [Oscillospiraceae bacterium]|nr:hypothetical protein [Oscillospiraceae bacterium]
MNKRDVEQNGKKRRFYLMGAVVLCAALLLALPFAAGSIREQVLYARGIELSDDFELSEEGRKYPFAVELYERALEGDLEGDFVSLTAQAPITAEEELSVYLDEYLQQNGVTQAQDWMQVWPVRTQTRIVTAKYSPSLRLYASAVATLESDSVSCTAVSIAYSELEIYDISLQPRQPLPSDPAEGLSMNAESAAGVLQEMAAAEWKPVRPANKAVLWEECAWTMHRDADGRGWLYRVDYATGRYTPACALPECSHDTAACAACFDVLNPTITDLGDTLLVAWYDGTSQDGYMKRYACMVEPFGGQRSPQVLLGKADIDNTFAANGRELLFATYDGRLRWMDLDGGWEKTLVKPEQIVQAAFGDAVDPAYTYWFIEDADAGSLTLSLRRVLADEAFTDTGRALGHIYELVLLRYDIAAGTLSELYRGQLNARLDAWDVQAGSLWRVDGVNGIFGKTVLTTGETQVWTAPGTDTAFSLGLEAVIDGKAVYYTVSNDGTGEIWRRFAVDADDGSTQELTLATLKKGSIRPIDIMDAGQEVLCVAHEIVAVTVNETVYGKPNSFVSDEIHYGFIPKTDFFADLFTVTPFVLPE